MYNIYIIFPLGKFIHRIHAKNIFKHLIYSFSIPIVQFLSAIDTRTKYEILIITSNDVDLVLTISVYH